MGLKREFVERATAKGAKLAPLCREYGVSRATGHKWVKRFRREGYDGLEEQSRRPKRVTLATAEDVVMAVVEAREAHASWGPKKLHVVLRRRFGSRTPSTATIARILRRFGKVRAQQRRVKRSLGPSTAPSIRVTRPNALWTVDFKGWWRTRDGARCDVLTVRDAFSRYVLATTIVTQCDIETAQAEFQRLFRKHGVPDAIQCDNGTPFISVVGRGGLTRLSAWWLWLGIELVRSRVGCPQDNGGHERMHRDMHELEANPDANLIEQQRSCDRFRQEFNHIRPHEALNGRTPAEVYVRSTRTMSVRPPLYPSGWLVRAVDSSGHISIFGKQYSLGRALAGYRVGLRPIEALHYAVWLRDAPLGELEVLPETFDAWAAQHAPANDSNSVTRKARRTSGSAERV